MRRRSFYRKATRKTKRRGKLTPFPDVVVQPSTVAPASAWSRRTALDLISIRRSIMRLRSACLCLIVIATLLLLSSCGTTSHPMPCGMPVACTEQSFVYATTGAGQILIFPVSQSGTLGAPASVPGPAIAGGNIAVSPTHELFVADHILDTLSAFVENSSNQYSAAPGSPYSL